MIAQPINLTAEERETLERLVRSFTAKQRLVFRARFILLASQRVENKEVAKQMDCRAATVSKWRRRFFQHRLPGLKDALRSGNPGIYTAETERRILTMQNRSM